MSEGTKDLANLTPEKKRALLAQLLQNKADVRTAPLSFAQQRLWFLDQLEEHNPTYNIPSAFRLKGELDVEALQKSMKAIIARHESLRTTFAVADGKPVQVISEKADIELPQKDLTAHADKEAAMLAMSRELAQEPFDLAQAPLMRVALVRLSREEHVLIVIMHHIVSDGWSMGIFIDELAELYRSTIEDSEPSLPELSMQYSDFAKWQQERRQSEILEKQISYWREQLKGAPPSLELATDYPRPPVQTFSGARHHFELSKELTGAVAELSRKQGTTLFMTLLAAFKVLLYRYTAQADLTVGTPIANRTKDELESLIGFFVNTLVLRTGLDGNLGFGDVLKRVRDVALGAYDHQDVPFERLVEELQPERDISRTPLFQVMFSLQNTPGWSLEMAGVTLSAIDVYNGMSKFDVILYMWQEGEALHGVFEYNTDLFEETTIRRMSGHFEGLLQQVARNPEKPISEIALLSEKEKQTTLLDWNRTAADYDLDRCLHRLFEQRAEKSPEARAVIMGDESLTYSDLNARANQLARHLQKRGAGEEELVGICVERSVEMVVALLAVMKSGAAYVPLDPSYPKERIDYMLEDADISVLITEHDIAEQFSFTQSDFQLVHLDKDLAAIAEEDGANLQLATRSDTLAYIIYTSGSTGKPKGVEIEHRALTNFLMSMAEKPGMTEDDVLLAVTTLSFDIAGLELYLPLLVGGSIVLADRETVSDGKRLADLLQTSGTTIMQATPATWRLLLDSGWEGSDKLKILCGGEGFPADLANALREKCASLWNMYGPTEATIWSTTHPINEIQIGTAPIGKPIANTQVYVLDQHLNPVPIGVLGELHIGGDGLARGYRNRAELTNEKFIENPLQDHPSERLYKTGDLVRFRPDGTLEFHGRIDHQVKIRGFRIELGEIESVLSEYPAIEQSVVVAKASGEGANTLVAYFTCASDEEPSVTVLRQYLKERLPEYMVPTAFIALAEFPLTPNGKVDRNALPEPEGVRPKLESDYIAPQNEVERSIVQVWQEVLQIDRVGIEDNFFDLGGHSLLLVQVQSRLSKLTEREISIVDLFRYPTVSSLAKFMNQEEQEDGLQKVQDVAKKQKDAIERQRKLMKEVKKDDGRLEYA